jgi:hypothetical protein
MATPIVPTRVALGSGVAPSGTTEVTYIGHTLTNAVLATSGTLTASSAFAAATSISTAKTRKAIVISAAADGAGGYFGSDATVSPATGHFVFPGTQLTMTGYNGNLWAVAPAGAQAQKFYLLET